MNNFNKIVYFLLLTLIPLNGIYSQIILTDKKWENGQRLNVLFMNGNQEEKRLFKIAVNRWAKYVNLDFKFIDLEQELWFFPTEYRENTIRVQFNKDEYNSSPLGTSFNRGRLQSLTYLNIKEPTSQKNRFISKASHEIGHALGLHHEHQHPDAKQLSEESLLATCKYIFFLDTSNEKELGICKRNLQSLTPELIVEQNYHISEFDPQSLMLYEAISGGSKGFYNTGLSLGDKIFMSQEYPFENDYSLSEIESMHAEDQREELEWIFSEYKHDKCKFVFEDDKLYLTKQTDIKLIKVPMSSMLAIDSYYGPCIR